MNAAITLSANQFKIHFDTILHLTIRLDELIGVHSWHQGGMFYIEYTTKTNYILTEYDTKEKWMEVLKLIDGKFEFS